MPETRQQSANSQLLVIEVADFAFDAVESTGGRATVVRFQLVNTTVVVGDVLLVLDGTDIRFHGMIGSIDDEGRAMAVDRAGSTLPSAVE